MEDSKRNMDYYSIEPEVAGGLGDNTLIDTSIHPPEIIKLHYQFDGWLGDVLLATFPVFIVTESAALEIQAAKLTGVNFDHVEVTTSEQFSEICPDQSVSKFLWLKVDGEA